MKRNLHIACVLLMLSITFLNTLAQSKEFYVAPDGSNAASGTLDAPFATFAFAKDKVQEYKTANPTSSIVVYFRGGKYYFTEPIVFSSDDSGTENGTITYKAYEDEVPELLGGAQLTDLSWEEVSDNIYQTSVPSDLSFETLFINGEKKILARYPNYTDTASIFNGYAADCIDASKVSTWANPTGGYVHALHPNRWGGIHYRITGKSGSSVSLEGGTQNNRGSGMHGTYRFVENIFEELDNTDEWYLNTNTSELYFYSDNVQYLDTAEIEYASLEQLIVFDGEMNDPVKYINIEGFALKRTIRTFMKTADRLLRSDWCIYRGGVVHFEGTENCHIKDCELSGLGGNAIFFNDYNLNSSATECHIFDVGASGICFVGDVATAWHENYDIGSPPDLGSMNFTRGPETNNYPQYCTADNNLIHNIGTVEKQPAGVHISLSAYITVSHNSIYDVPRAGINISEGKYSGHILEHNDVFNTVLETEDHGAFNSWGRDRYYSKDRTVTNARVEEHGDDLILLDILDTTIIRNNRFRCDHGWDIDLDDGSSYYHIYNNVCLSGGIKLRDGYHRKVENNITINNSMHQHVWLANSGDIIRNNIFTNGYYPIGMGSWGTEIDHNLFFVQVDLENSQDIYGVDENSVFGDPLFVDPDNGDFTVSEGSKAYEIGFKNIPMDEFGVQVEKLKAIAETPEITPIKLDPDQIIPGYDYYGGKIKNLETDAELSATGLGEKIGAMVMKAPDMWLYSTLELVVGDVVLHLDDEDIITIDDLEDKLVEGSDYDTMFVWRYQEMIAIPIPDISDCSIPTFLDSDKWELIYTDGEADDYLAKYAFDNNINTFWHTVFDPSDEPYPHEIIVDMGKPYQLDYMEFTGRQGSTHPRIEDYELYVTSDLDNWGDPVLQGTLLNTSDTQNIKIENINDGQYFKFVGLSGYSREAAAIAELNFYGACGSNLPPSPYRRIEAEDYHLESGTSTITTSDIDGEQELSELENDDYIVFKDFNFAAADSIDLRVACATDGATIEVRLGAKNGKIVSIIQLPNTGSATTWQTIGAQIDVIDEKQDLYFVFKGEGNNLFQFNWFQLKKYESPFDRLESEDHQGSSGDHTVASSTDDEDEDGQVLSLTKANSWVQFNNIDLSGVESIFTRYGTTFHDSFIEVRIDAEDGEVIGTINLTSSGGWSSWKTAGANISNVSGVHDVYFVYQSETKSIVCNSNWFQFSELTVNENLDPLLRIEAEDFYRNSGTSIVSTTDIDGEEELSEIQNGDWVSYKNLDLTGIKGVDIRVASAMDNGRIEVRVNSYDSGLLTVVPVPNTGSSSSWEMASADLLYDIEGIHDIYLVFRGTDTDFMNVNWIQFTDGTTAIPENELSHNIKVYPNPFNDMLTVRGAHGSTIKVYDTLGRLVFTTNIESTEQTIDLSELSPAYYLIKVIQPDGSISNFKVIKNSK